MRETMKKEEALAVFNGSQRRLAEALGLSVQAVNQWGDEVPPLRAYQIREIAANGGVN
jgi:transcriptional repressor of cell division inhibition gene dicB